MSVERDPVSNEAANAERLAYVKERARRDPSVLAGLAEELLEPATMPSLHPMSGEVDAVIEMRVEAYDEMCSTGRVEADARMAHPERRDAYRFMTDAMSLAGIPVPRSGTAWWLWTNLGLHPGGAWCLGQCPGPFVCPRRHVRIGHVLCRVVVPGAHLLASSFQRWDMGPIRGFYLPGSERDGGVFSLIMEIAGAANASGMRARDWPDVLQEIGRSSWPRVFDLAPLPGFDGLDRDFSIPEEIDVPRVDAFAQAVVAELRSDQVVEVVYGPARTSESVALARFDEALRRSRGERTFDAAVEYLLSRDEVLEVRSRRVQDQRSLGVE